MLVGFSLQSHFVVSKGGFLALLQIEVLVLAPGQELQVFRSLTGAVGSFGSWELLLTPVLWVRNLHTAFHEHKLLKKTVLEFKKCNFLCSSVRLKDSGLSTLEREGGESSSKLGSEE